MLPIEREYRYVNLVITIVISVVLFLPVVVNSVTYFGHHDLDNVGIAKCFYFENTGRYCKYCGITRSMLALYRGDYQKSKEYNLKGLIFVILLSVQFCIRFIWIFYPIKLYALIDIVQLTLCGIIFLS